ncbi:MULTISPECIES: gamma-glutamylcyclotransferase [Anaeromyxobacter]|uniref:gamma-glutamylcyclotransferase n=1 Tax=Anaeromyxobacter TaxID=161492 RepID=UPI001F55D719|nr:MULTISPECIES: gamma-glutamylcyclotransferase [unclassified Anaeromyxobacter]
MKLPLFGKAHEATAGPDFVWFVYGSSLDGEAFAAWAQEHGYAAPSFEGARRVRLVGYRLAFDVLSRAWGGAVANLARSPGDVVEGIALPMPGASRGLADHREGAVSGLYEAFEVELSPVDGGPHVPAIAYRATNSRRLASDAPPSPAYLEVLLRGARARGLSDEWIRRLEALAPKR